MRRQARDYGYTEKWVECLNCSQEYVVELVVNEQDTKGCPVCGSHAYDDPMSDYSDWRD